MLTVGLPIYKMQDIAYLALESLCNQINAPKWELIIIEEKDGAITESFIRGYEARLNKVNCVGITYISLDEWMPLGDKWVELIKIAKGEQFILQSGDCYSQPFRLRETWELRHNDWVPSKKGLFYDIGTKKTILFNQATYTHPCGLNMAFKTNLAKDIKKEGVKTCVDSWLFRNINPKSVGYNTSDSWVLGLDTNGRNKLSQRKEYFETPRPPFKDTDIKPLETIIKLI